MALGKRDSETISLSVSSIILDIEGTTTSISFVKDVLFPYVRSNLDQYINENWDSADFKEFVNALRNQAQQDENSKIQGVIMIPEEGEESVLKAAVINNIKWQMDNDRKTKNLKDLQGVIMEKGYKDGDLKGHVYDDVEKSLKSWVEQNKSIYIYSSGSVNAQKLLFGHSEKGDLLPLIKGHFDTTVGMKGDVNSYTNILKQISSGPSETAFLTDVPKEARAAKEAGIFAVLVSREGNAQLSDEEKIEFPVITSFEDIEFETNCKKRKTCSENNVNIDNKEIVNSSLLIEENKPETPMVIDSNKEVKSVDLEQSSGIQGTDACKTSDELMDVDEGYSEKSIENSSKQEENISTDNKIDNAELKKETVNTECKKEEVEHNNDKENFVSKISSNGTVDVECKDVEEKVGHSVSDNEKESVISKSEVNETTDNNESKNEENKVEKEAQNSVDCNSKEACISKMTVEETPDTDCKNEEQNVKLSSSNIEKEAIISNMSSKLTADKESKNEEEVVISKTLSNETTETESKDEEVKVGHSVSNNDENKVISEIVIKEVAGSECKNKEEIVENMIVENNEKETIGSELETVKEGVASLECTNGKKIVEGLPCNNEEETIVSKTSSNGTVDPECKDEKELVENMVVENNEKNGSELEKFETVKENSASTVDSINDEKVENSEKMTDSIENYHISEEEKKIREELLDIGKRLGPNSLEYLIKEDILRSMKNEEKPLELASSLSVGTKDDEKKVDIKDSSHSALPKESLKNVPQKTDIVEDLQKEGEHCSSNILEETKDDKVEEICNGVENDQVEAETISERSVSLKEKDSLDVLENSTTQTNVHKESDCDEEQSNVSMKSKSFINSESSSETKLTTLKNLENNGSILVELTNETKVPPIKKTEVEGKEVSDTQDCNKQDDAEKVAQNGQVSNGTSSPDLKKDSGLKEDLTLEGKKCNGSENSSVETVVEA